MDSFFENQSMDQKQNNIGTSNFCNRRKAILLLAVAMLFLHRSSNAQVAGSSPSSSQTVSFADELKSLYDISTLPAYRSNSIVAQQSSYDTTGGNDDGFSGKYSFVRKNADGSLVILDIKGAGTLARIWTPTPTDDTLDFYLDNDNQPSFSVKFRDLFSGKVFPFVAPLCGNELGGFYCYVPIPFQQSCKVVSRGKNMQFYQIQYRLYPEGTQVKKFSLPLDAQEKAALQNVSRLWNKEKRSVTDFAGDHAAKLQTISATVDLRPGDTKKIADIKTGGRILGIEMDPADAFSGLDKRIDIRVTWDDERDPAIYCPVADFFGYAFGSPSMQSLLLGSMDGKDYCYFPMPFDRYATLEMIYRSGKEPGQDKPARFNVKVYYTRDKREARSEGKFYSHWSSQRETSQSGPHVFLSAQGKGQYVGTLLQAQGLQPGMTLFFEGDDSTAVDGQFRMHGTGSEDHFNGGWYALLDRWDTRMSLPLHGSLDYSLPLARTGAYRLYLSDKISFEKDIFQSIEHGPTDNVPAIYTSLAFYYSNSPVGTFTKPTNELSKVYIPDTLMIYPQLMKLSIGGRVDFKSEGSLTLTANDGAVVRVSLDEIPYGKYRLYADLDKLPDGCEFSLWQRQSQISGWISVNQAKREHMPQLYLCDIAVKDFKNTLTFRFRTNGNNKSLFLNRLIFIRIPDEDKKEQP